MSVGVNVAVRSLWAPSQTHVAILLSVGYALFVVFFPWELVSRGGFPDFDGYVETFDYFKLAGESRISMYELSTVTEYLVNEVLIWLQNMTGSAVIALRIASFFILFVSSLFIFKHVGYRVAPLFLFNPSVIDVSMSGIRNGLAWSLIIIALWNRSKLIRVGFFLVGMFIHSTTLALFFLYYSTQLANRLLKGKALLITGLAAGIFLGVGLTFLNELVLGVIGDRRSGLDYVVGGDSFRLASIWAILLYFQCTSGHDYIRRNIFVIALLAWYQIMNPYIPGSYRIWAALFPVVALSMIDLPAHKRKIFLFLYSGYLAIQWFYWSKIFNLFI